VPAGRSLRLLLGSVILVPLALAGVSSAGKSSRAVVVRDAAGEVVLPAGGRFSLAYRHSYYRAPAREIFRARRAGFELAALVSTRAAVLDYYALTGRRTRSGGEVRLDLRHRPRYRRLSLIATVTGRRTLVAGERRVPLYGGPARHLTLAVEGER
jgi:Domain of unknown function (DUF1850)